MSLLALPEDLVRHVLRDWLLDWDGSAGCRAQPWTVLSALDTAACGGKFRPHVQRLLRGVVVQPESMMALDRESYSLRNLRDRPLFVRWIESRGIDLPLLRLTTADLEVLGDDAAPELVFLKGIVWFLWSERSTFLGADDPSGRVLRRALGKVRRLTHFGVQSHCFYPDRSKGALDLVLQQMGAQLTGLSLSFSAVGPSLLTTIAASCPGLQYLELELDRATSRDSVTELLQLRGGQLRVCKITALDCAPQAGWWEDTALMHEVLRHTHLELRCFSWTGRWGSRVSLPCDALLEALHVRPQLLICEVGRHRLERRSSAPDTTAGPASLVLHRLDGASLESALCVMAQVPGLQVCSLHVRVMDSPQAPWLPTQKTVAAFANTSGRSLTELQVVYIGDGPHTRPLPVLRLAKHLPSLRSLRVGFFSDEAASKCSSDWLDPGPPLIAGVCLRVLHLDGAAHLTDALLDRLLHDLPALEELELRACGAITAAGLAAVTNLRPRVRVKAIAAERPQCNCTAP